MTPTKRFKTQFWIALALLSFLAVCLLSPVKELFDEAFLVQRLHALGGSAAPFFVLVFAGATSLGFPGNVMSVAAGAVFGVFWGAVWSVIGATLGATGAFLLARYSLHQWADHYLGKHAMLRGLNQAIARNPFNFVLAVRLTPLSPFSLVNFLFGLTPISLRTYALGTFLGIIPLSLAYAWLGMSGIQALHGGDRLPLFLALSFLTLLSVLPMLIQKERSGG
ncbi:TVP38/TMEM64 family protein [Kovacikia minuta CCNUW1]|uniref:TVP38/TMEM64 family protein n=1 Tax=Kovacikia minuta TaxID=2931930 RepID=UPI001CCAE6C8|nr:TVP38/TMEM64 family protein [Kovacikia minuta]UBF25507.1 TVP38/TMEM64 family protein [Kovacikia minuta CCNUW1]